MTLARYRANRGILTSKGTNLGPLSSLMSSSARPMSMPVSAWHQLEVSLLSGMSLSLLPWNVDALSHCMEGCHDTDDLEIPVGTQATLKELQGSAIHHMRAGRTRSQANKEAEQEQKERIWPWMPFSVTHLRQLSLSTRTSSRPGGERLIL